MNDRRRLNERLLRGFLAALALAALALNAGRPGVRSGWWSKACLIPYMARTWEGRRFRSFQDPVNPVREMVGRNVPAGASIALVSANPSGIDSFERTYHIAVAWERLPSRVPILPEDGLASAETDGFVLPPDVRSRNWNALLDAGFEQIADVPSVVSLWMRTKDDESTTARSECAPFPTTPRSPREE